MEQLHLGRNETTARATWLLIAICICAASIAFPSLHAEQRYVNGLYIAAEGRGPIELFAYAEASGRGQLRMQHGSLEDAPTIHEVRRLLSSIPLWMPIGILVTTDRMFRDERAERRQLVFSSRMLNVYAIEVRVVDLERREKIESLLKSVRASYDSPGYAFVVLSTNGGYQRFYPFRLTPDER